MSVRTTLAAPVPARPLSARACARRHSTSRAVSFRGAVHPGQWSRGSFTGLPVARAARRGAGTLLSRAEGGDGTPVSPWGDEEVFYEGTGAKNELYLSCALGVFILWLPLTLSDVGRFLWIKYRFTDKRASVIVDSPIRKFQQDIAYTEIKSVTTIPRMFGLWGDMAFKLKDGQTVQISCIEPDEYQRVRDYIRSKLN